MIDEVRLHLLAIPLREPYKLAFGAVTAFDTVLAEIDAGGQKGFGEATILTGYTDETIDQSWEAAKATAAGLPGLQPDAAKHSIAKKIAGFPFTATALTSAIEMCERHPLLQPAGQIRVPILAGINSTDTDGIVREMDGAIAAGFDTLKIKVGFEITEDLTRVAFIQRHNAGRVRLRIDGNQGYSHRDGVRFAASLEPDSIELLEQPCAAADWDAASAIAQVSTVPFMLDESIYECADIDRAAAIGASFVKLKLMKLGSLDRLVLGLERIRSLGMTAVLGNGVAGDIGCWMEACVACAHIGNAGEMNGFRRQRRSLLADPLPFNRGAIVVSSAWTPSFDPSALPSVTVDTATYSKQFANLEAR